MPLSTLRNVRFKGLASCVPKTRISNLDCPAALKSERERLVRNIGIQERRLCLPWQCFSDLAFTAAEKLLADLAWAREEIDALIVVTQSPDFPIPATAIILQDRLKLSASTLAFDINLGCSGYPYGLYVLGSMIAAGTVKRGLLLIGDKCGTLIDPLFSDCGTATALEYDANAPPMHFDLNSDGSGYRAIILPVGGHREPMGFQHFIPTKGEDGQFHSPAELILDGTAVLNFSITRIPPAVKQLAEYCNTPLAEIDYLIFHQANRMINETLRKKLGLAPDKTPSTLQDFGNTSSASVPLTMTARIREQVAAGHCKLLLCGFGIGLSWASCIIETDAPVMSALLEA